MLNTHDPAFIGGLLYGDINREWTIDQTTTTTNDVSSISLPSIPGARQHMFLMHLLAGTGTTGSRMTVNNQSGAQYAYTRSVRGESDIQSPSSNFMTTTETTGIGDQVVGDIFQIGFLGDDVANQKLIYVHAMTTQGNAASIMPRRIEIVGKANLLNQNLTRIDVNSVSTTTGTFTTGSNVSSCSIRQKPINRPPFWEHLTTNRLDNSAILFTIPNIPNRRYLWVQAIFKNIVNVRPSMTLNGDGSTNYAETFKENFASGTDLGRANTSSITLSPRASPNQVYVSMWIANLSTHVKQVIGFSNIIEGGSSSQNVPSSFEFSGKWSNTTGPINAMRFTNATGEADGFAADTSVSIWGSRT